MFCFLTRPYSNVSSVIFSWFPLPLSWWFKCMLYLSSHSHVYCYSVNNCKHVFCNIDGELCFTHLWIFHTQHNVWHTVGSHCLIKWVNQPIKQYRKKTLLSFANSVARLSTPYLIPQPIGYQNKLRSSSWKSTIMIKSKGSNFSFTIYLPAGDPRQVTYLSNSASFSVRLVLITVHTSQSCCKNKWVNACFGYYCYC